MAPKEVPTTFRGFHDHVSNAQRAEIGHYTMLSLGDFWQRLEMCWVVTPGWGLLASGGWKPWMLAVAPPQGRRVGLRYQQCEVGKPWGRDMGDLPCAVWP